MLLNLYIIPAVAVIMIEGDYFNNYAYFDAGVKILAICLLITTIRMHRAVNMATRYASRAGTPKPLRISVRRASIKDKVRRLSHRITQKVSHGWVKVTGPGGDKDPNNLRRYKLEKKGLLGKIDNAARIKRAANAARVAKAASMGAKVRNNRNLLHPAYSLDLERKMRKIPTKFKSLNSDEISDEMSKDLSLDSYDQHIRLKRIKLNSLNTTDSRSEGKPRSFDPKTGDYDDLAL